MTKRGHDRLTTAGLVIAGLVLVWNLFPVGAQVVRNALTTAMLQKNNFTLAGSWDFSEASHMKIPAADTPPAGNTAGDIFLDKTVNDLFYTAATGTHTSIGGFPSEVATNLTFTGTVDFPGLASAPGNVRSVDYLYPGEQPHWLGAVPPNKPLWVDVPIASNQITIRSLLFVVAEADWSFTICESKTFTGCNFGVMRGSSTGWAGDFGYSEAPITYVDRDGTSQIHVRVQGADWFTFRAIIHYTVN